MTGTARMRVAGTGDLLSLYSTVHLLRYRVTSTLLVTQKSEGLFSQLLNDMATFPTFPIVMLRYSL